MNTQPEAQRLAGELDQYLYTVPAHPLCTDAAALLRTQHADLERKDALLRQALEVLEKSRPLAYHFDAWEEALRALNKELSK